MHNILIMKLNRSEFSDIEKPLIAIRRYNGNNISWRGQNGFDTWLDEREGTVALRWRTPEAFAVVKSIAEFHYPFIDKPMPEYALSTLEDDKGLRTRYSINDSRRHGTIFKHVGDSNADTQDFESYSHSSSLGNQLGINTMTTEDVEVLRGIVQRRIADL